MADKGDYGLFAKYIYGYLEGEEVLSLLNERLINKNNQLKRKDELKKFILETWDLHASGSDKQKEARKKNFEKMVKQVTERKKVVWKEGDKKYDFTKMVTKVTEGAIDEKTKKDVSPRIAKLTKKIKILEQSKDRNKLGLVPKTPAQLIKEIETRQSKLGREQLTDRTRRLAAIDTKLLRKDVRNKELSEEQLRELVKILGISPNTRRETTRGEQQQTFSALFTGSNKRWEDSYERRVERLLNSNRTNDLQEVQRQLKKMQELSPDKRPVRDPFLLQQLNRKVDDELRNRGLKVNKKRYLIDREELPSSPAALEKLYEKSTGKKRIPKSLVEEAKRELKGYSSEYDVERLLNQQELSAEINRRVAERIPGITTRREAIEERYKDIVYPGQTDRILTREDYETLSGLTNNQWKMNYAIDPSADKTVTGKKQNFIHQREFANYKKSAREFLGKIDERSERIRVFDELPLGYE